jgi:multidrug resistance efflux pump
VKKPGVPPAGTRVPSASASFGPAAVKELETLRTKYAAAQEQIEKMQAELDRLKGATNGEATTNGTSSSEALEKTQAELEAAMAELEEKAKTVAELQQSVAPRSPA